MVGRGSERLGTVGNGCITTGRILKHNWTIVAGRGLARQAMVLPGSVWNHAGNSGDILKHSLISQGESRCGVASFGVGRR